MPKTIKDALRVAAQRLSALPQASAHLEAELLLCDATGHLRTYLMAWPQEQVADAQLARYEALIQRRLEGEPIAYILGRKSFWTLELRVTPDTLIPRPETELLVELALEHLSPGSGLLILDAGSGCGAIASALASERPAWTLIALDKHMNGLRVARDNFTGYALDNARTLCGDWLACIAERSLDAIVANPPYIPQADPHLGRGDLPWEPVSALASGADGLDAIRALSAEAAKRLKPRGFIALEHAPDQGPQVRGILAQHHFRDISTHRDLGRRERATTARLRA